MIRHKLISTFVVILVFEMAPVNWFSQNIDIAYSKVNAAKVTFVDNEKIATEYEIRLTDFQSNEVADKDTSGISGDVFLNTRRNDSCRTEVFKNCRKVAESKITLQNGSKCILADIGTKPATVIPHDKPWWSATHISCVSGLTVNGPSTMQDRVSEEGLR